MELHTDLPTDLSCTVISTSRLRCVFVHGLRTNGKSFPGQKSVSRKRDVVDRRQLLRSPRSPFLDSFRLADDSPPHDNLVTNLVAFGGILPYDVVDFSLFIFRFS